MYMPMTMLAIFAALNIESLPKPIIRISYFALITIGLLLSISTYQRNVVWSDRIAFLRDTAQKSPNKFRPQYNLGTELGRHGLFVEAKLPLQKAAVLRPNDSEVHNQLANIFMKEKQTGEAEKHYRLAIANDDANAEALYNLAMLLGSQQRYTEQKIILEQFILKAPPYLDKQKRWATQYLRQ
jgi:Tfp pilus assembly protein PilF